MLAALLAACSGLLGPDTATDADLEVAVRVSRAEVVAGDTLMVTVVARNPTRRSVPLPTSGCVPFSFEVHSVADERVARGPDIACLAIGYSPAPRLAAGDSVVLVYGWAASAGASTGGLRYGASPGALKAVPGAGVPLAPGAYRVRAVVLAGTAVRARGDAVTVRVRATP